MNNMQCETTSLKLISQIGHELIKMAQDHEGLENWQERHTHIRLFAEDLYGDCDEATMLSTAMALQVK
ncbi:hypothetical protein MTBPR1_20017 [Candidatus Terasakiella magnetica]|uniref:Uncharacterized protein n=1 Tax=Candidatus Terasakiella magnetica TaxID=1867952 RepID=A0A1C3RFY3_9PROT|nr:hypothetical protein [Candidatus Terasakiella magnetica]SCA56169.1 hypothetical protein MTBPR1_20017 [Candidatus Terasakiella magnetica]